MSGEVDAVRHALYAARRAYHDSTRWAEERIRDDGAGPTYEEAIGASLDAAEARMRELAQLLAEALHAINQPTTVGGRYDLNGRIRAALGKREKQ